MVEMPFAKMIVDTPKADGGLYFYEEYMEWKPKAMSLQYLSFQIRYDNVQNVSVIPTRKKQIVITTKDGKVHTLMTYKEGHFFEIFNERLNKYEKAEKPAIEMKEEVKALPNQEEDTLAKLERLAALHEKNALTDEEFKAAKAKILGLE